MTVGMLHARGRRIHQATFPAQVAYITSPRQASFTMALYNNAQPIDMIAVVRGPAVDAVNCPKCGYNNVTGSKYCTGTVSGGGSCGQELPQVV